MSGETVPTDRVWTFDAEPGDEWTPDDEFIRVEDVPTALPSRDALVASIKAATWTVPNLAVAGLIADRIIVDAGVAS